MLRCAPSGEKDVWRTQLNKGGNLVEVTFDNPFFDEISKYPVRFAAPVFYGDSPHATFSASLNNGTATLVKLGDKYLAVTCHHVLEGFRQSASVRHGFFQLAHVQMVPDQHLVDESRGLDLAVLDMTRFVGKAPYLTEANFVCPTAWPPGVVSKDDVLCLAGFPGVWRDQVNLGYIRFYSYSSGAAEVLSIRDNQFATTVQIQDCITQINHGKIWGSLGGLSGGPVFAWRKTPVLIAELVGFIYEYQENFDLMLVRSAAVIREDGTLIAQPG